MLDVGIKGALTTIESSLKSLPNKYIIASSSEVYNKPKTVPTTELERTTIPDILNPRYSYAGAKLISEIMTINYFRNTNIKDMIFRPHNVFGPNMGFEHVIPEIMAKLYKATNSWKSKKCDLTIQGDGTDTRAFCFIDDAIDQIITLFDKGEKGNIYNVGMNKERSIEEVIYDIGNILKVKINIIPGEQPTGATSRRCPSIDKVSSLGYNKSDNYADGLEKTVIWYKDYYKKYN